jgi:hypothetical protein
MIDTGARILAAASNDAVVDAIGRMRAAAAGRGGRHQPFSKETK